MTIKAVSNNSRKGAVDCVSGILIDHGRVLVEKRRMDDEADPGLVFLPGGHVESGESLQNALARELKEELGIQASEIVPVEVGYHLASDGERQRVHYFRVMRWTGKIKSLEAERAYWESESDNLANPIERRIVSRLLKRKPRKRPIALVTGDVRFGKIFCRYTLSIVTAWSSRLLLPRPYDL